MKKRLIQSFIFIILVAISPDHSINATSEMNSPIDQQLTQLLQTEPALAGALAGVSIRSASTGELLYEHLGDIRLRPASNLKLLTAAVALFVLGEDYRFTTEVRTDGQLQGGTLLGNLFIIGKGDPTLLVTDLDRMAIELKKKGVTEIQGNIVADDSWYDHVRYSLDLPWSDETTYYGAQISALTVSPDQDYDTGTVLVEVKPGKDIGSAPAINLKPLTNYVKIINHAVTISPDGRKELTIEREHGTNTILVEGTIPMKASIEKEWVAVSEPSEYSLELFQQSLTKQGIKWSGKGITGTTPQVTTLLTSKKSIPLSELLVPFMKLSNNGHAEILVKEMGKVVNGEGSWEKGLEVMVEQLPKLGIQPGSLVLRDGSGISHVNLIPANELTSLLYTIQNQPWFSTYLHSLPIAGEKGKRIGGTLRYRMKDNGVKGKVRAKTGTISTVSTLSGYIETRNGKKLIFSILLNNLLDEEEGKEIEDKLVRIIAKQ